MYSNLLADNYMPSPPDTMYTVTITSSMVSYSYHCCCMHVCVCVCICIAANTSVNYIGTIQPVLPQLALSTQPTLPNWNRPNGDGRLATPSQRCNVERTQCLLVVVILITVLEELSSIIMQFWCKYVCVRCGGVWWWYDDG